MGEEDLLNVRVIVMFSSSVIQLHLVVSYFPSQFLCDFLPLLPGLFYKEITVVLKVCVSQISADYF